MRTKLKTHSLRYDGVLEVDPSKVFGLFVSGVKPSKITVTHEDVEVADFNFRSPDKLKLVNDQIEIDTDWNIPEKYLNMDTDKYVEDLLKGDPNAARALEEYALIKKYSLIDWFKTIIYIIETFKEKRIVWGVGRGSACSVYLFYKMKIHLVDPVKYNIPYTEFFH